MPPIDNDTDGTVVDQGGDTGDQNNDTSNADAQNDQSTDDTGDDQGSGDASDQDDAGENDSAGSEGAPESYADFAVPEGVTLDQADIDSATALFKEAGLSQEQAQMFVDYQVKQNEALAEGQTDAFNQQVTDWETAAKADKEFGGEKFDESMAVAKLGMEKLGTPELKDFLEQSGAGSNPEVLRTFYRAGLLFKEDNPGNTGEPQTGNADRVSIMYPNN